VTELLAASPRTAGVPARPQVLGRVVDDEHARARPRVHVVATASSAASWSLKARVDRLGQVSIEARGQPGALVT
jgi:hypothetical protein